MLTEQQIQYWREVLHGLFGSYAFIMPVEDIERFKILLQAQIDSWVAKDKEQAREKLRKT